MTTTWVPGAAGSLFDVDNLPDPLKGKTYYRPSGNGEETDS